MTDLHPLFAAGSGIPAYDFVILVIVIVCGFLYIRNRKSGSSK